MSTCASAPVLHTGILDGNHGDWKRGNLQVARDQGGITAVIAKATQGVHFRDPTFDRTVATARLLNLLTGAYHFGDATDGAAQAEAFLARTADARATGKVLLCLDLENNPDPRRGTMPVATAVAFVQRVYEATGTWPVCYTGRYVVAAQRAVGTDLARCPLWMAAYGPDPLKGRLPAAWSSWALWQYTNGGAGPTDVTRYPRKTPGFGKGGKPGGCDRSVFRGTAQELRDWWTSQAVGSGS